MLELEIDVIFENECENDGGFCILCEECVYSYYFDESETDEDILILTDSDFE